MQSEMKKYTLPKCLKDLCEPGIFEKWLERKTLAHVKRDHRKGLVSKRESYKSAIYNAVSESNGLDAYTGKAMRWDLISKWDNDASGQGGREYKKKFGDLPTLDHVYDDPIKVIFKICSWRINDCKNDLSLKEFINVCNDVLHYHKKNEKK
jgi:hypothetical protein